MNIPAWLEAWWQTLTGVEVAVVVLLPTFIACMVIEITRLERESETFCREMDRLAADRMDRATESARRARQGLESFQRRASLDADSRRSFAVNRRPMWGDVD